MIKKKKVIVTALALGLLCGSLAGCGTSGGTSKLDLDDPSLDVMLMAYNATSAQPDSPVIAELEKVMGSKLNFTWVPSSGYDEKVTTTMGAGVFPHLMMVNTVNSSIIQASRNGLFWDLTDKLTDSEKFPNLAQSDPNINHNISVDGHVYGVYRTRELGRSGVTIRKDWLDKLGLKMPETMDEFYEVLRAFTYDDPDGNGQNDTYGMTVTTYLDGPLDNIAIWMGAPNQWGVDEETGDLVPDFTTKEYMDALKFMNKCYDEGLINQNMATLVADKWDEDVLSGNAGVIIDMAGRARRIAENMQGLNPNAVIDVMGYVKKDASSTPRTRPTTGYAGYFVIPKASVPTEEELDFVLGVLDKGNEPEALTLMNYGIEGRNFNVLDGIYAEKVDDAALVNEYSDLNQFATILEPPYKIKYTSNLAEKAEEVQIDNRKYAVTNIAEPYTSDTYSTKGPQLDAIISEANLKFIVGDITEDDYNAQLERWRSMGGDDVVKEINEAYHNDELVQK